MTKATYKRKHLFWGLTVPDRLYDYHGRRQAGKHGTGTVAESLDLIHKHKAEKRKQTGNDMDF